MTAPLGLSGSRGLCQAPDWVLHFLGACRSAHCTVPIQQVHLYSHPSARLLSIGWALCCLLVKNNSLLNFAEESCLM